MQPETKIRLGFCAFVVGLVGLAVGAVYISAQEGMASRQKRREDIAHCASLCEDVKRRFDENNNGLTDPEEGAKMAMACGYDKIIPTSQGVFKLEPYPYVNGGRGGYAVLTMSNQGSYSLFGSPSWADSVYVPTSRLEKLAQPEDFN